MTDIKQRFGAACYSKRALPFSLLSGLALFFLFGGYELVSLNQLVEHYMGLKTFVDEQRAFALLIFGAAYILTVALCLPIASLLTLAGGALLGWTGAAIIICAATIGATIVFIAARTVLNEFFAKRTSGFMVKLEVGFQKNAFYYLVALRLIPAAPFWAVNIVPALLGMRLNQYVLATFVGIIPGTLLYVWVARSFDSLLSRGQSPEFSVLGEPSIIVPLFALSILSLVPAFWKQLQARHQASTHYDARDDSQNEGNNG